MIGIIIQARMSSSRLPNKVLKPIEGRPMLAYLIERVKKKKNTDKIILATSVDPSDGPIEEFCQELSIECYRGKLDDVLDRYYQAALKYQLDTIVRVTGDCPIIDPLIVDEIDRKSTRLNSSHYS